VGLGIAYAKRGNREGLLEVYQELAIIDAGAAETFAMLYVESLREERKAPSFRAAPPSDRVGRRVSEGAPHPLAESWYGMGLLHRKQGRRAEALSDFLEAVRFDSGHGEAWREITALLRAHRPYDGALRALREVVRAKPKLAVAWYCLGLLQSQRGQHPKALKAFQQAVALEPRYVDAWIGLGTASMAVGDERGLAAARRSLWSLDPRTAEAFEADAGISSPAPRLGVVPSTLGSVWQGGSTLQRAPEAAPQSLASPPRRAVRAEAVFSFEDWLRSVRKGSEVGA
jgi:tetratricopeptide (TPR) repeat protein